MCATASVAAATKSVAAATKSVYMCNAVCLLQPQQILYMCDRFYICVATASVAAATASVAAATNRYMCTQSVQVARIDLHTS